MNYIIYQALNKVNNKSYIGMTIRTIQMRKYLHYWVAKRNAKSHFHKALIKYDESKWCWNILESGISNDKEFIKQREIHFINTHNTFNEGYNMTKGGEDFTSSEYQRCLQQKRVADGSHPFLGGEIQRKSAKKRWDDGTSNIIGLNQKRIEEGTHNLLGNSNPQRRRKIEGQKHHNQKNPWDNTKADKHSWLIADQLHDWYLVNKAGPYKMADHFKIKKSLQVIYYKYFEKGWTPLEDKEWLLFKATTLDKII